MTDAQQRTALYRLYNAEDALLYVGISADPQARWRQHSYATLTRDWWPQVARKTVEWFPNRDIAYEAETKAIKTEGPRHNRAMRADGKSFTRWRNSSSEIQWIDRHLNPWSAQITKILSREIETGVVQPGDIMPTARQLYARFGVSEQTCRKVLRDLATAGILHQRRKGGRYYCSPTTPDSSPNTRHEKQQIAICAACPAEAAAALRAVLTGEQLAALVDALQAQQTEAAPPLPAPLEVARG